MSGLQYPCVILTTVDFDRSYKLIFCLDIIRIIIFESSTDYKEISNKGLQESFRLKVPFYNDAVDKFS